jgi:hypothetical protein
MSILGWSAVALAALAALLLVAALNALFQRRLVRSVLRLLYAATFLALGAAAGAVALGIEGYRALTREETAATVRIEPLGNKRFRSQLRLADGTEKSFVLAGDEFYIDARILKWHPLANLIGLHTAYELDRIAGRYLDITEEKSQPRTVFALAPERPVDLFGWRRRYALLGALFDAEYGSATFSAANEAVTYDVRVSTTGLLIRRSEPKS